MIGKAASGRLVNGRMLFVDGRLMLEMQLIAQVDVVMRARSNICQRIVALTCNPPWNGLLSRSPSASQS